MRTKPRRRIQACTTICLNRWVIEVIHKAIESGVFINRSKLAEEAICKLLADMDDRCKQVADLLEYERKLEKEMAHD